MCAVRCSLRSCARTSNIGACDVAGQGHQDCISRTRETQVTMFAINPIGTCRINTPIKRGAARYPIALDYRRVYGFVHTSAEALQQLRYRAGEVSFPENVLPVLFRPGEASGAEPPVADKADLTVIEISSAKSCMIDGVAVQSNYLVRYFADFFSPPRRARRVKIFWDLVRAGNREKLHAFLDADPVYRFYSSAEKVLLASVSVHMQSFDNVFADMAGMVERVGRDRVVFVTHVNAVGADGSLITSRDKLIRWVRQSSVRLNVPCFDPTELMRELGQDGAMEKGGLDLTHFTPAFSDRWYATFHRDFIVPHFVNAPTELGDDAISEADELVARSIETAMEQDDFFDGTRQLFAARKQYPHNAALRMLHGQLLVRLGDFDSALELLAPFANRADATTEFRRQLLRVQTETGNLEGALAIARTLIADEYDDADVFEAAAFAADNLGLVQEAMAYRKLAFRLEPQRHRAATQVLDHYRVRNDEAQLQAWLHEILTVMEAEGGALLARAMAEWAVAARKPDAIGRALVALASHDMGVLPNLFEEVAAAGLQLEIAPAIATIAAMPEVTDRVLRVLRRIAAGWGTESEALLAAGRWREAYSVARACIAVTRNNGIANRVSRGALDRMRMLVLKARNCGDNAEIARLCEESGELVFLRRDVAIAYVRALSDLNRLAEAQEVAQHLEHVDPDNIDIRATHAQIAAGNGDFQTALALFGALAEESPESTARHRTRIDRFLSSAAAKGVRHVRIKAADGLFEDAIATCRLLHKYTDAGARIDAELQRLLVLLRAELRALEDEDDGGEALRILNLMLSIAPSDPVLLRRAAFAAMKVQDFGRAISYWRNLEEALPGLDSTARNIHRCEVLLERQSRKARLHTKPRLVAV